MEVEAKFVIPDRDTLDRLKRVVRLGPFTPGESLLQRVRDVYVDTAGRALYQEGLACRFRHRDGTRLITLKGLDQIDGSASPPDWAAPDSAVHERFESERVLPDEATMDPATWPEWEGRDRVLSTIGEQPLEELFVVDQERYVRPLLHGERLVAELSVDEVRIVARERCRELSVLEAELATDGTTGDLDLLVEHLAATWALVPEPQSKFALGLALLGPGERACESPSDRAPVADRVSLGERAEIEQLIEETGDERLLQRACLILGWGEGVPVCELCEQVGLSLSWSYELIKRFREQRLAFFTEPEEVAASPVPDGVTGEPEPESGDGTAFLSLERAITVDEMCVRYGVELAHARRVRDLALALFDATRSVHKLGPERRRLLAVMGLLHNVGLEADPARHHVAGRDIILENSLVGVTELEKRMLAAAVYLHRKRMRRKRLRKRVVVSLPPSVSRETLVLSALLRLADGLDYSQSQTSALEDVRISSSAIYALVSGPHAQRDAARAQAKADLWEELFDAPFFFSVQGAAQPASAAPSERDAGDEQASLSPTPRHVEELLRAPKKSPGILADDPMSEAGRKVFYFHFVRMLQHEPGTRAGEDIEELHDMRVATRRMRSAFRVFAPYYKSRAIRPYVSGLKRTGRVLGAVRDLDVFMERARSYLEDLPPERADDLDPLLDVWEAQRERARAKMTDYLDGERYRDFVDAFRVFVQTPGAAAKGNEDIPPTPTRVGHVVPYLIYERWARVQAFGPLLEEAPVPVLHALRIACKRLRYTLEFFREVLGPKAEQVIDQVILLQDHLGSLNDADVANGILSDFLFASRKSKEPERVIAPGVVSYLAAKQRELQALIAAFPQAWEQFNRPEVRRWLADAVSVV